MGANYVTEIVLNNFRNYQHHAIKCDSSPIIILGKNGVGKTNILEALSLLSPGRGIRFAQPKHIGRNGSVSWALNANVISKGNECNVGIGFESNRKIIKIDHKIQEKQVALTKVLNLIWLTPQMNTIFLMSRKQRLNFFDRIVFSFNPNHAQNVSEYEYAKRERVKLLKDRILDENWLFSLEAKMAKTGIEISQLRLKTIKHLQHRIDNSRFNHIQIMIKGEVETLIEEEGEEEVFVNKLKEARNIDMLSKRTQYGVHKSNFSAYNKIKDMPAELCSTGEQKLMLIALILAAIKEDTVLLLDDIVSNLDKENRSTLFHAILQENCQAWITDTNPENFNEIKNHVQRIFIQ